MSSPQPDDSTTSSPPPFPPSDFPRAPWYAITPHISVRKFPLSLLSNNLFLIRTQSAALVDSPTRYVLIDTGDSSNVDALLSELEGLPIEYVILTHTHFDHTGAAKRIQSREAVDGVQARIVVHELEKEYLATGESFPTSPGTFLIRILTVLTGRQTYEPCLADYTYPFKDEDDQQETTTDSDSHLLSPLLVEQHLLASYGIRIHHFPGHTPGHLCIEWRGPEPESESESEILSHVMILGDLVFRNLKPFSRKAIYPYDFPMFFQSRDIAANRQLVRDAFVKILTEIRPQAMYASHACCVIEERTRRGQEPTIRIEKIRVDAIERLYQMTDEEIQAIEASAETGDVDVPDEDDASVVVEVEAEGEEEPEEEGVEVEAEGEEEPGEDGEEDPEEDGAEEPGGDD